MTLFNYSGFDETGQEETSTIEAASESAAFQMLKSRGIRVYTLLPERAERHAVWYNRDVRLRNGAFNLYQQAALAQLFGILIAQSIPLPEVLKLLSRTTSNKRMARHLKRVEQDVSSGNPLGAAFSKGPEAQSFSPLFLEVVHIAEISDAPQAAFARLSKTLRRQHKILSDLQSALVYPAILILVACGVIAIMVGYLAPTLAPMFTEMGRPMPTALRILMWLNDIFASNMGLTFGMFGLMMCGVPALFISQTGRRLRGQIARSFPIISTIQKDAMLLNEIESLSLLLNAQIPLAEALKGSARFASASNITWIPFEKAVEALQKGGRSADVISADKRLPETLRDLYKLGEANNQLPEFLEGARLALEATHHRRVERTMGLVTPVLTLILGLGIGGLIYSVMGAILEVNQIAF